MKTERRTGRTTMQMTNAPHGSVFVWCNERLDYPKCLAMEIGRGDLKIVGPSWIIYKSSGLRVSLTIDHATELNQRQTEEVFLINSRSKK